MSKTKIEWTDHSWNPVTGCTKISPGCDHCYAETRSKWLAGRPGWGTKEEPFKVTMHPERLGGCVRKVRTVKGKKEVYYDFPKKPSKIFLCSMGDLFHDEVADEFIGCVLRTIRDNPHHTFQVLTKRPARMRSIMLRYYPRRLNPLPNLWLGVTAENQAMADLRLPILLDTPAALRFVSCEPLLGPIDLKAYLFHLDWIIVGGETKYGAREMKPDWLDSLGRQCGHGQNVPIFLKQWGDGGSKNRPPIGEHQKQFPWVDDSARSDESEMPDS